MLQFRVARHAERCVTVRGEVVQFRQSTAASGCWAVGFERPATAADDPGCVKRGML